MTQQARPLSATVVALTMLGLPIHPASAQAPITAFTVDATPRDEIGRGQVLVFTPSDSQIVATGTPSSVKMQADQGEAHSFSASISAPPGQVLAPGTYETEEAPNGQRAGLVVTGDGHSCASSTGYVTIQEIVVGPLGNLLSFSASYAHYCWRDFGGGLFGELRYNTSFGYQATLTPNSARFEALKGSTGAPMSIEVASTGSEPLEVKEVVLGGFSFSMSSDSCTGASVPPGDSCEIEVTYTPHSTYEDDSGLLQIFDGTRRGYRLVELVGIPILPTATKTRLLGHYAKKGKLQLFHKGDGVLQIGWVIPDDAADRITFEAQWKRRGEWVTVARKAFEIGGRGLASAVFGAGKGTYRARGVFEGKRIYATSSSVWDYFRVTA